ncbi:hypothetical protein [Pseudomonas coleopterorum]|uniref:YXWGXW repeat-containing protein n=1 Tax=Pseudomonas coleopterorum TaxID=1605838 RepID=A0ABR9BZ70_9PSED|nr:hypothetical protein [Pseudomonas coleopterorum]MBD8755137.1 hypothetical protein [Pseudomonas coleopterorum]MBD8770406.1 hypothetical protein [Pseudomonas coleopterorum]
MNHLARMAVIGLALGMSACAVQRPSEPAPQPPVQTLPPTGPSTAPTPAPPATPTPPAPKPMPRTSASFAPPPGGASHWDPSLGVYVLEDQPDTYYRQRTYYRWNDGWSWATSPKGPWEATDTTGVPAGLGRKHP